MDFPGWQGIYLVVGVVIATCVILYGLAKKVK
jgi:hypothetical protein